MDLFQARRLGARGGALLALAVLLSSTPVLADQLVGAEAVPAPVLAVEPEIFAVPEIEVAVEEETEEAEHIGDGHASYYGAELAGNRTASGERFNPRALTAAHRTLPMGSRLRVTNKANGKSVIVRINDRGPFAHKRVLDLSRRAAEEIQMVGAGVAQVRMELLR